MAEFRNLKRLLGVVLTAIFLGGCFVTEDPLLNEKNGRAHPLKPGVWMSCGFANGEQDGDCNKVVVTLNPNREYHLIDPQEEVTTVRFRKIRRRAWLAQMNEEGDDGCFYLYGTWRKEAFTLTLMNCSDVPDDLRNKLVEDEELEIGDEAATLVCKPKTLNALTRVARRYHDDDLGGLFDIKLTPLQ